MMMVDSNLYKTRMDNLSAGNTDETLVIVVNNSVADYPSCYYMSKNSYLLLQAELDLPDHFNTLNSVITNKEMPLTSTVE